LSRYCCRTTFYASLVWLSMNHLDISPRLLRASFFPVCYLLLIAHVIRDCRFVACTFCHCRFCPGEGLLYHICLYVFFFPVLLTFSLFHICMLYRFDLCSASVCVLFDCWRHRCCQFARVECISRLSGFAELTLRYTTPDVRCRHRRYECDGGIVFFLSCSDFHPRDAMLAWYLLSSRVCLSVRHKSEL